MKHCLLIQGGDAFDLETETLRFKPKTASVTFSFIADELKASSLEEALFSPSFFSETFVCIQKAHELSPKALELVVAFAKAPRAKVWLLLQATGKTDLGKHMPVVPIPEVKPWDKQGKIAQWIGEYVKAQAIKIHPQAVQYIAAMGTTDRFYLRQELDKLISYVGDKKEIAQADIQAICTFEHEQTVWQLSDAFLQRNTQKAQTILHQLLGHQVSAFLLVRQLRNVCHQALMMLSLSDNGSHSVQEHFPQLKGKMFEKNFALAKEAGKPFLTQALLQLDKAELALKDSPFDETTLLMKVFI